MSLARTVADVIDQHVILELESLNRVYLNVYQPRLQTPTQVFYFLASFRAKAPFLPTRCEPSPNNSSALWSTSLHCWATIPANGPQGD